MSAERDALTAKPPHAPTAITQLETKYRQLAASVDHIDGNEMLVDVFTTIANELSALTAEGVSLREQLKEKNEEKE